jgi:hypothetical protein
MICADACDACPGGVRMLVRQPVMPMGVVMRFAGRIVGRVLMLTVFIVHVRMRVLHRFVSMLMSAVRCSHTPSLRLPAYRSRMRSWTMISKLPLRAGLMAFGGGLLLAALLGDAALAQDAAPPAQLGDGCTWREPVHGSPPSMQRKRGKEEKSCAQ